MSTSVLLVASLLITSAFLVQASKDYYVKPAEESICPDNVTCHTFDHYLSRQERYFTSGVTFHFLPGVHPVSRGFSGHSIVGMKFVQYVNGADVNLTINTQNESTWFILYNSSQITFTGINILTDGNEYLCNHSIVDLINVSDVHFSHMLLNNSCGSGLSMCNTTTMCGSGLSMCNTTTMCGSGLSMCNTTTQARSIRLDSITVNVHGNGITIRNIYNCIIIANSHFIGSHLDTLIYVVFNDSASRETCEISIEHCDFYKGSSSIHIQLNTLAAIFTRIIDVYFNAAHGSDIQVYASGKGSSLNVLIDGATLTSGKVSGILLDLGPFSGTYNITVNNSSVVSYNESAIRVYLGSDNTSQVLIENSVVKNNQGVPTVFPVTGMLVKGLPDRDWSGLSPLLLKNVTFEANKYTASASIDSVVTVLLFYVGNVTITDCHFRRNTGTALYLEQSTIRAHGTIVFSDNIAYDGAALFVNGPSKVLVNNDTTIIFLNNTANHTGGAIYISNSDNEQILFSFTASTLNCFFAVTGEIFHNQILVFDNNTARDGGEAIYGGVLDQSSTMCNGTTLKCITAVKSFSKFKNMNATSMISSDPSRACFCEQNKKNCTTYTRNTALYPGQNVSLSAYVVGQNFGSSKGTVYAQFLNKTGSVGFSPLQKSQIVSQHYCNREHNVLNYTIKTPQNTEYATLVLTAEDVYVSEYVDKHAIDVAIKEYHNHNCSYVPSQLLQLPLYIDITFRKCPAGFSLSSEGVCDCNSLFKSHSGRYKVTCDIEQQTIQREYSVWVNVFHSKASYSKHCPLSYCNPTEVLVNLSTVDGANMQCVDNHCGVLCGQCQDGYSLAIGSSRCLPHCSNKFLSLLLLFAAAGVLLVAVIKYFNLTVTWGALNGLIFYANIVQTYKSVLLTPDQKGVKVFALFIAWLNLDFGIETCFFDGLDMYSKTWLQFAFPLYIWTLAGAIILVCRYSQRATRVFGNNAVQVLATLLLLSYNKVLQAIIVVYSAADIQHMDISDQEPWTETVWAYDGRLKYFHSQHGILFVVSTFIFVFLWIPFTFCILFGQWLQRYNHCWGLRWVGRVRPLLDAYYGPLKDPHRYWVGILLLARIVVLIPAADPFASPDSNMLTVILLCVLLFFFASTVGGMYKKYHLSILENTFFVNLITFASVTLYLSNKNAQAIAVYIMIGLCLVQFLTLVAIQLFSVFHQLLKKGSYKALDGSENLDIQTSEDDIRE